MRKFLLWSFGLVATEVLLLGVSGLIDADWAAENALLIVVTGLVLVLVAVAIQDRPTIAKWLRGESLGTFPMVSVHTEPVWRFASEEISGCRYFLNRMGVIVFNPAGSRVTAKNVRVRVYLGPEPIEATTREGAFSIDLNPGDQKVFEIGNLVSKKPLGRPAKPDGLSFSDNDRKEAEHNVSRGHHTFDFSGHFGAVLDYPVGDSSIMGIYVVRITAEGAAPVSVRLSSNTDGLQRDQSKYLSPIAIEVIE